MTDYIRPRLEDLTGHDLTGLAMTPQEVAQLTRPRRESRVLSLMEESTHILNVAEEFMVREQGRELAATVIMFSGGNDSTTVAHLFRGRATHVGMANTLVGVEQTRQYVRDTAAKWGLPLVEKTAPRREDSYVAHVLEHGFPGRGKHPLIYQRLKQRAFRAIRAELVAPYGGGRRSRVVLIMGRRRTESEKRSDVPELEREGATVYASPIVNWTKLDLNTYRLMMGDVPTNQVSDLCHMSAECLCGCYAQADEREMITSMGYGAAFGTPEEEGTIAWLEAQLRDRDDIPEYAKTWGWSADPALNDASRVKSAHKVSKARRPAGFMCETCD